MTSLFEPLTALTVMPTLSTCVDHVIKNNGDSHSDAYETDFSGNVVDSQVENYTSEGTPSDKGKKKASDG